MHKLNYNIPLDCCLETNKKIHSTNHACKYFKTNKTNIMQKRTKQKSTPIIVSINAFFLSVTDFRIRLSPRYMWDTDACEATFWHHPLEISFEGETEKITVGDLTNVERLRRSSWLRRPKEANSFRRHVLSSMHRKKCFGSPSPSFPARYDDVEDQFAKPSVMQMSRDPLRIL